MLYKERARRNQLLLIGMIVLLAAIGIIIWQRQHIKLKNAKADALIAEASFLKKASIAVKTNARHWLTSCQPHWPTDSI